MSNYAEHCKIYTAYIHLLPCIIDDVEIAKKCYSFTGDPRQFLLSLLHSHIDHITDDYCLRELQQLLGTDDEKTD